MTTMHTTVPVSSSECPTCPNMRVGGLRIVGRAGYVRFGDIRPGHRPITIGRGRENHIQIADATVSRRHCEIAMAVDMTCIIQDCGATNGIRISEIGWNTRYRRVEWHALRPGMFVRLGRTILVIVNANGRCPLAAEQLPDYLRLGLDVYNSKYGVEQNMTVSRRFLNRLFPDDEP
jgi:hypothetical protein